MWERNQCKQIILLNPAKTISACNGLTTLNIRAKINALIDNLPVCPFLNERPIMYACSAPWNRKA